MKTKLIIFINIFFLFGVCNAQTKLPDSLELNKNTLSYIIKNDYTYSLTYKYSNKSNQTIWLWIEKNDLSNLSDLEKIRGYFYKIKNEGDVCLYQIGMDGGVGTLIPEIFNTFIKCIPPNKDFSIQISSKKKISEKTKQKIFSYFDKRIVVYSEKDIITHIPSLNHLDQIVFFKGDFLVLSLDILKL